MSRKNKNEKPRVLAVTLARGGSKSIKKKNIRNLCGKPLIYYTITEALKSKYITRYLISTDDKEIQKVAIKLGAEAPFIRPPELSTDTAKAIDADRHALKWAEENENKKYDFFVELMITNPMKTAYDIDLVIEKLINTNADSVIGMSKLEDHHPLRIKKIINDKICDFNSMLKEIPETHRQQLKPDAYIRNGSIYAAKRDLIIQGIRYGTENSRPYIMPDHKSINIDTENDFLLAELIMKQADE